MTQLLLSTCLRLCVFSMLRGDTRLDFHSLTNSKSSMVLCLRVFSTHKAVYRYMEIGPEAVLARLTGRLHHFLSLQISSLLQIRPDAILKHWARSKIARSRPVVGTANGSSSSRIDDEICDAIVRNFEMQPAVSFADIAKTAWNAGRTRLATKVGQIYTCFFIL